MKEIFWYIFIPFRVLYKLYFVLLFLITAIPMYPIFFFLLKDETRIHQAFQMKRLWSKILAILMLIKIKIKGQESLPKAPYVICANHTSFLDILVLFVAIPETFLFLGKAELLKWPIVRTFFKNMDIPVDRSNKLKAKQSLDLTKEAIQKGYSVCIFPEGTIPEENLPKMVEFKSGAFKLAISQNVPIIPVSLTTNWLLLSDFSDFFGNGRPGIAECIFHPPIKTTSYTDETLTALSNKTFEVIDKPLQEYYL